MKALTVQQPWAWAIVHGGKDVENRTQAWSYRGPLAIHAGMRWSFRGGSASLIHSAMFAWLVGRGQADPGHRRQFMTSMANRDGLLWTDRTPLGAIIGVVDLVDVHPSVQCEMGSCSPWAEYAEHGDRPRVHLELANPRPLAEPVPCRGALGLWTVPSGVDDQVLAQLEAVTDA